MGKCKTDPVARARRLWPSREAIAEARARLDANKAPAWNGMCPAGKHGLDFEGQDCDVCTHERGGPCMRDCRRCHADRQRALRGEDNA